MPDGSTLISWLAGKSVAWDVTVVSTLAESCSSISARSGGTAEHAVARKSFKHSFLPTSYVFLSLTLETLSPINTTGISFLSEQINVSLLQVTRTNPCKVSLAIQ